MSWWELPRTGLGGVVKVDWHGWVRSNMMPAVDSWIVLRATNSPAVNREVCSEGLMRVVIFQLVCITDTRGLSRRVARCLRTADCIDMYCSHEWLLGLAASVCGGLSLCPARADNAKLRSIQTN